MGHMRLRLATTTLVVLLLTACTSGEQDPTPPAGDNRPSTTEPTTEPEPEAPAPNPTFGTAYTWDDGLTITIGTPTPFTPTDTSSAGDEPAFVQFPVTIVNNTPTNYDPNLFYTTVQSGNVEATQVYDSAQLPPQPSTPILPGREAAFTVAWGVTNPADLVMQVTPSFDKEPVIYTT